MDDSNSLPMEIREPPEVPEEIREHWNEHVESRKFSEKVKNGMRWVLAGYSYREAAHLAGYPDSVAYGGTLWHRINLCGLRPWLLSSKTQLVRERSLVQLSGMEQMRRLLDEPEKISDRDLIHIRKVGWETVGNAEGWRQNAGLSEQRSALSAFEELAHALAQGNARMELTIEPAHRDHRPEPEPMTIEAEKVEEDPCR